MNIDSFIGTTALSQTNKTTKVPDTTSPHNIITVGTEKNTTGMTPATMTSGTATTFLTFSAMGTISSLNFNNDDDGVLQDIAAAKKIILSGYWNLYVNNGKLSLCSVAI